MSEALTTIARDPRCLLAVSANDGGSWFAPLQDKVLTWRNFEVNPQLSWPDFQTAFSGIGLDDFELDFTFNYGGNGWTFICNLENVISVGVFRSNQDLVFTVKCSAIKLQLTAIKDTDDPLDKPFRFRGGRRNGNVFCYLDDTLLEEKAAGAYTDITTADFATYPYVSNRKSIYNITLRNTTKGTVAYQAPMSLLANAFYPQPSPPAGSGAWPVRTGLLTYNNITTANGAFEGADKTQAWDVKTALDLRGYAGSFSVVSSIDIGNDDGSDASGALHPIVCQGYAAAGSGEHYVFTLWYNNRSNQRRLQSIISFSDNVSQQAIYEADLRNRRRIHVAMTWSHTDGALRLYLDGVQVAYSVVETNAGRPLNSTMGAYNDDAVYLHQKLPNLQNFSDRIHAVLIYDTALTAAQIAHISKVI